MNKIEQMAIWMVRQIYRWTDRQMDRPPERRSEVLEDGWSDGWTGKLSYSPCLEQGDGWENKQTDGQTDRSTQIR